MIRKKLFAVAMTAVMVLSTSVMAFAVEGGDTTADTTKLTDSNGATGTKNDDGTTTWNVSSTLSTTVTANGEMQKANIKVTVPTSNIFAINPYKLYVHLAGMQDDYWAEDGRDYMANSQIVSPIYKVTNEGEIDLQVDAVISGEALGGLTLAGSPVSQTGTKREAFIFVNFVRGLPTEAASAITATAEYDEDGVVKVDTHVQGKTYYAVDKTNIQQKEDGSGYELTADAKSILDVAYNYTVTTKSVTETVDGTRITYTLATYKLMIGGDYDKNATQGIVSTKETTYKNVGFIKNKTASDAERTLEYNFDGSTPVNPTGNWTGEEKAKVNIKFNFTPVVE